MVEQRWRALLINDKDNVATALADIPAGATVSIAGLDGEHPKALNPIPFGHKIAITVIKKGQPILKYGVPIAFALTDIPKGKWIHNLNAKSYFVAKREGRTHEPDTRLPKA